jgi:hypothetical protein
MPKTHKPGGRHAVRAAKEYQKKQKAKARANRERRQAADDPVAQPD